jgi:hypothetical protein
MKQLKQPTNLAMQVIFTFCFVTLPVIYALAGPHSPGSDPGAPIDGGISLLVAAGVGYGIKKVYNKKKKHEAAAHDEKAAD